MACVGSRVGAKAGSGSQENKHITHIQVAPIKKLMRVCEKVILEEKKDFRNIRDLVRGKVLCDSCEMLNNVVSFIVSLDSELNRGVLFPDGLQRYHDDEDVQSGSMSIRIVVAKNRMGRCNGLAN